MTREVNDSGEIPRLVGESTQRLHVDTPTGPLHTIRRSDATAEQPLYSPTGFTYLDTETRALPVVVFDLTPPGQPRPPKPLPTPPPAPKHASGEVLWDYAEPIGPEAYVGRHRAPEDMPVELPPGRFAALRSVLSAAMQRIKAAIR